MSREETLSALEEGVRLFNDGYFFECHEVLEDLWIGDRSEFRELYQGLIKSAVALYHAEMGNFKGARSVLESGLRQLQPYAGRETPVEIEPLLENLRECVESILSGADVPIPYPRLTVLPDRLIIRPDDRPEFDAEK